MSDIVLTAKHIQEYVFVQTMRKIEYEGSLYYIPSFNLGRFALLEPVMHALLQEEVGEIPIDIYIQKAESKFDEIGIKNFETIMKPIYNLYKRPTGSKEIHTEFHKLFFAFSSYHDAYEIRQRCPYIRYHVGLSSVEMLTPITCKDSYNTMLNLYETHLKTGKLNMQTMEVVDKITKDATFYITEEKIPPPVLCQWEQKIVDRLEESFRQYIEHTVTQEHSLFDVLLYERLPKYNVIYQLYWEAAIAGSTLYYNSTRKTLQLVPIKNLKLAVYKYNNNYIEKVGLDDPFVQEWVDYCLRILRQRPYSYSSGEDYNYLID